MGKKTTISAVLGITGGLLTGFSLGNALTPIISEDSYNQGIFLIGGVLLIIFSLYLSSKITEGSWIPFRRGKKEEDTVDGYVDS